MTARQIVYRKGYKYQLAELYTLRTKIKPAKAIETEFIRLTAGGTLTVRSGYAWDGPSGPILDTPQHMRGSLVHDALYQLMRAGLLNRTGHRRQADRLFANMCRQDGVAAWWAKGYYHALQRFAKGYASAAAGREVHTAP